MRIDSLLITVALFIAFIPGVAFKLGQGWTVYREGFGNYGPTCPNGYTMQGDGVCVPAGHPTQPVNTGFRA